VTYFLGHSIQICLTFKFYRAENQLLFYHSIYMYIRCRPGGQMWTVCHFCCHFLYQITSAVVL